MFKISYACEDRNEESQVYAQKTINGDLMFLIANKKNDFVWVYAHQCKLVNAETKNKK